MNCQECRFSKEAGFDLLECRRHAPIAVHDPNKWMGLNMEAFVPRWPMMGGGDSCGDFEARPAAETASGGNGRTSFKVLIDGNHTILVGSGGGGAASEHAAAAPADAGMLKAAFYDGYTEREEELRRYKAMHDTPNTTPAPAGRDRTAICKIVGEMLDAPGETGIFPTTIAYDKLEALVGAARAEAIGWAHADACADLDAGLDPRKKIIPEMLARAKVDLGA